MVTDELVFEPISLLDWLLELVKHEPKRFAYKRMRSEDDLQVHTFEIIVEAFDEPTPLQILSDGTGGEIYNLYELAMLNTLLEMACQEHGWDVRMVMTGAYEIADYDFDLYDIHMNHIGSGSDSSRESAFIQVYLEALTGYGAHAGMDA